MSFLKNLTNLFKKQPQDVPIEELSLNYEKVEADEQGPADVAAIDPVAFNKSKGNVEFEWKVEEGESAPPPEPAFGVEREMKESGEKGGTENTGVSGDELAQPSGPPDAEPYLKYKMEDVLVSSYSPGTSEASEDTPSEEVSFYYNKIQTTPESDPGFTPDPPPEETSSWNFERAWPSKVSGPSPKSDEGETSEVEHKIAPDQSPEPSLSDAFLKYGKVEGEAAEEGHKVAPSDAVSQSEPPGDSTAEGSGVDTEPFLKWTPPEPGSDVSGVKSDAFQKVEPDDTAFNKAAPDEATLFNKAAPVDPPPLQKVEPGDLEGVKATSEAPSAPGEDVSVEKPEEPQAASSDDLSLNFPKVEMPAQEAPSPPGEEEGIIIIEGMPADDEEPSTLVNLGETPSQETARLGDMGAELGEEDLPDVDADDLGGP